MREDGGSNPQQMSHNNQKERDEESLSSLSQTSLNPPYSSSFFNKASGPSSVECSPAHPKKSVANLKPLLMPEKKSQRYLQRSLLSTSCLTPNTIQLDNRIDEMSSCLSAFSLSNKRKVGHSSERNSLHRRCFLENFSSKEQEPSVHGFSSAPVTPATPVDPEVDFQKAKKEFQEYFQSSIRNIRWITKRRNGDSLDFKGEAKTPRFVHTNDGTDSGCEDNRTENQGFSIEHRNVPLLSQQRSSFTMTNHDQECHFRRNRIHKPRRSSSLLQRRTNKTLHLSNEQQAI